MPVLNRTLAFTALACATSIACSLPLPASAQAPADTKVDLRLFPKEEVNRTSGCSLALWQSDRDPDKDRFAHMFLEDIGRNDARQPARMKIGDQILQLRRIATGGRKFGYSIYESQLYRAGADGVQVILDLKLEDSPGEAVDVNGGTLTIVQTGKPPFVARVKGGAGCMTPPAAAAPPAKPAAAGTPDMPAPGMFNKYAVRPNQVPAVIRNTARTKYECNDAVLKQPVTGFQMSEESAIWELACDRFAYQGTSIYVLVYLTDPAKQHTFLTFKAPPGKPRSTGPALLMSPVWDIKSRVVTGISLGRGSGDCGTLERHRVGEDGQFVLIEYRDKPNCDGAKVEPRNFPLVFRGK